MHLPGSVAFRQIVVGILEERRGKKGRENCRDHACFSLVQSAGVICRRGMAWLAAA